MTDKEHHIEVAFIEKAKKDKSQFGYLYEKYYRPIFIFIFKKIQNEDIAGDVCSKTFLKAMMNLDKYEDRGHPFSSWLYRIASNEVNQYFRSEKKTITIDVDKALLQPIVSELEVEDNEEDLLHLLDQLSLLPLEKSQLIELRFFEGLSFKEIGSIFDISEATAKMRLYRAIEKLKTNINKTDNPK